MCGYDGCLSFSQKTNFLEGNLIIKRNVGLMHKNTISNIIMKDRWMFLEE